MKLLFPTGYRSEAVLAAPVKKRLRMNNKISIIEYDLISGDFWGSYALTENLIHHHTPDFAYINADRVEMAGAAAACFNFGVPFSHTYAGIGNNIGTSDDINRHCITLWSAIQFCESEMASKRVKNLRASVGLPIDCIYTVGITHLDDVVLRACPIPEKPYDLVTYNPPATQLNPTEQERVIHKELEFIFSLAGKDGHNVLALFPAPDRGHQIIKTALFTMENKGWTIKHELPRSDFLFTLKNCERFISNSSAVYYEAPVFIDHNQIFHIGSRNSGRDSGSFQIGASDRIVKILAELIMK